jgi:hypothetical protein
MPALTPSRAMPCLLRYPAAYRLIQVEMMLLSLNVFLFLIAFVWLRYSQPLLPRPFRIPGGT